MKSMAKTLALALVIGTAVASTASAQDAAPPPEALAALRHFVLVDCEVGEEGSALDGVLLHAEALEPELGRLLVDGPDGPLLDEVTAALEQEWERRAAFLESNPRLGLDADALRDVLSISREEFIAMGRQRFDLNSREKAVVGLAAIGSAGARSTLREAIARVGNEGLRELIRSALKGMRREQPSSGREQARRDRARRSGSD
jgi:hypothetical protein